MTLPLSPQADAATVAAARVGSALVRSRTVRVNRPESQTLLNRIGYALLDAPASAWMVLDALLVAGMVQLGYWLVGVSESYGVNHIAAWQGYAVFVGAFLIASLVFGLYERETLWSRSRIVVRSLLTTSVAVITAYALIYVVMYATASRRAVGCAVLGYLIGGTGIRLLAWWFVHNVRRPLLVVGSWPLFESFQAAQERGLMSEYRLVGYTSGRTQDCDGEGRRWCLGANGDVEQLRVRHHVTDMVVGSECSRDRKILDWILPCLQSGCRVTNEATFYEKAAGQILVDELTPEWFLFADLSADDCDRLSLKRIVDLLVSTVGLLATLPLWPWIALAIKLCDGGPVFYSQQRVGLKGNPFPVFKFRTMRVDAENGHSVWASPNDSRVTAVGRLLRRTRIDELPQLVNVLLGQMSLIGPRPERPDIVARLGGVIPFYNERHLIKPGLTGWAQISYKYGSSIEDAKRKLQFDLYYLKNACFELDMMILFRTLGTFLRGGI
ncbi:MAG: exopolysaccharide biosynthesis polyprenyl glycosylphosphotransferase [Phycisphaerales bacterium]|nr:MAG: exopolysaccharide biosynthesis polyprenyl glycosylphosphotransferase [Phycisphaerales bacterium]